MLVIGSPTGLEIVKVGLLTDANREQSLESNLELLRLARQGDRAAFELLVHNHHRRVRAFCSAMLNSAELGDDAAQDVFLRAYQSIQGLRDDAAFSAWLMTLARNRCVDIIRAQRREGVVPIDAVGELSFSEDFHANVAALSSPEKHEALDLLNKMLARLPFNQREILLLRELYGFSYEELGAVLSLSLDGVKGQLKRARAGCERILRHLLNDEDVDEITNKRSAK